MIYKSKPGPSQLQNKLLQFTLTYCKQMEFKFEMHNLVTLLKFVIPERDDLEFKGCSISNSDNVLDIKFRDCNQDWCIEIDLNKKRVRLYVPKFVIGASIR
jgi:hypothetical protein